VSIFSRDVLGVGNTAPPAYAVTLDENAKLINWILKTAAMIAVWVVMRSGITAASR